MPSKFFKIEEVVKRRLKGFQGDPDKKDLIDVFFQTKSREAASFADLGAVWGIDAGYTFYALDKYNVSSAFIVDTDYTKKVVDQSKKYKNLTLITGNFGKRDMPQKLGKVDAIFLFDVLLHQVNPNWNEIMDMYAPYTDSFLIFNPQYIKTENTVRLLDLGVEEYFKNVPHDKTCPSYIMLFEKMYEPNLKRDCIWRDTPDVWQWGITDNDLCAEAKYLGYEMLYYKNCGQFGQLTNFENHAFLFTKPI